MPEFDRDLQSLKEEVRARSDIVEIISQVTQLKRSGKNWTGLCPFHADKKPSFSVSPLTQSYRCWSCGEERRRLHLYPENEKIWTFSMRWNCWQNARESRLNGMP